MKTASLYLNVFILTISFVMSIFGLLFVVFGWCDPVDLFADLFSVTSFLAFFRSLVIIIMYVVCEVFKKRKMTYWPAVVMDVIMGIGVVICGLYAMELDDSPAFAGMFEMAIMFCSLRVVLALFIVDIIMSIRKVE